MIHFTEKLLRGKPLGRVGKVIEVVRVPREFYVWNIIDGNVIAAYFNEEDLKGDKANSVSIRVILPMWQVEARYRGKKKLLEEEAEKIFNINKITEASLNLKRIKLELKVEKG